MDTILPVSSQGVEEEQRAFARAVHRWADRELVARRHELREDYDRLLRPALRGLLLELGLQSHLWPEAFGGDGQEPGPAAMTLTLALEQVGRGDVGLGVIAGCQLAVAAGICGEQERAAALAPQFCNGKQEAVVAPVLPVLDLTGRPDAPLLDGRRVQATAHRDGETWVVDGEGMRPLVCGQDAVLFAVLCHLEERGGHGLVLVPGDSEGVRRRGGIRQTGLAAARNALIDFRGVRVPSSNLVLEGEVGWCALRSWLGLCLAATCSGALLAGLEILADWAESRVIKGRGQRFVDNSLVAEVMVRVVQRSTLTRIAVRDLARLLAELGPASALDSALTVAEEATAAACEGLGRAMELMGSAGYATEWNLERYWRDVRTVRSLAGASVLNRIELARRCFGHGETG